QFESTTPETQPVTDESESTQSDGTDQQLTTTPQFESTTPETQPVTDESESTQSDGTDQQLTTTPQFESTTPGWPAKIKIMDLHSIEFNLRGRCIYASFPSG
uniref:Uncharacterized protein n=1 Tax=Trichobilharzia regenti TaxID=157069 RepID=A0AA85JAZ0_TRIRE